MVKNTIVDRYIAKNKKKGLVIKPQKNTKSIIIPFELKKVFNNNEKLETCFKELTSENKRNTQNI